MSLHVSRKTLYNSPSPLLASKTPMWRSKFIVAGLALAFAGLAVRAAYVQVLGNDFYIQQGNKRFARTLSLPADRGKIYDRNGLILASSIPAPSIWANPEGVEANTGKREKLAALLGMSPAELNKKLDADNNFVWLKRQVPVQTADRIAALKIKGVYQRKEYQRQYPEGEAMAHVVGFNNIEDNGQEGVERMFNALLGGKNGSQNVIKDRLGGVVENVGELVPPENGKDVQLSVDSKIQFFAYQRLRQAVVDHKAKSGSSVVLDSQTGEVLAMVNYPSFLPENRNSRTGDAIRNRALTDTFEPGSTIKPFVVALAMDEGLINPSTPIATPGGQMTVGDALIRDTHPRDMLTVSEVVQKSSNVGTVKISTKLTAQDMWGVYDKVGFGRKPAIGFPGVVSGRLRDYKEWRPVEKATISYGYGISSSLFQLAQAYTVFANQGQRIPISLIKQAAAPTGEQIFKPETAAAMRKMLHLVTMDGGTAVKAQTAGFNVGGKTGTVHRQEGETYMANQYRSFFVGLAPIEKPRIIVAVMLDDPRNGVYYGGDVAAPVFSDTVQQSLRILGVQPDTSIKPKVMAQAEVESIQ